jgi:hypothetical protein
LEDRCVPSVTAANDTFTVAPNKMTTLNVLANDTASADETLQLDATTPVSPSNAILNQNANGTLSFYSSSAGTYSFDYTVFASSSRQQVTSPDGAFNDNFGWAVAMDGDTAVIAANNKVVSTGNSGALYVFVRSGGNWLFQQELTAAGNPSGVLLGTSVAVSGNTIVAGSPFSTVGGNSAQGAAYVFTRSGTTWTQAQVLTAGDGAQVDDFGTSVAIDGGTIVVGADQHKVGSNTRQGAAYVFTGNGSTWSQQQELTRTGGIAVDDFGYFVAVRGGTIAASSVSGTVVFANNGGGWAQQQLLAPVGPLAIDGTTLVIGASAQAATTSQDQAGAAYIYTLTGTTWTQQQELTALEDSLSESGTGGNHFGAHVALSGDHLIVGNSGEAFIFSRSGTTWTQQQVLNDDSGGVAVSGETYLMGNYLQSIGGNSLEGTAYFQDCSAATAAVSVSVVSPAQPPVVSPVASQTVADGATLSFTVNATTGDSSALKFSLGAGAPAGASINAQTGGFTWTPSQASGIVPGSYSVSVIVGETNDPQLTTTVTFTVKVGPSSNDQGSGVAARQAVALSLTQSAEYYSNIIRAAYTKYLSRSADAQGLAHWLSLMQSNALSDEGLEAVFIGSQEYINNHGGPGQGWIVGMYQNLLGRTPGASEVQHWLGQLAGGATTTSIAYGFAASQERESQRVAADYQQYLGRTAQQSEIQYWVNLFVGGGRNEQVIAGFISSQEYFQNAGGNIVDWLYTSYRAVLNHVPDAAGLQHWLSQLH